MENWLTVADVVKRLRVHERTVRRWITDGRLPATAFKGRTGYRIAESDLLAFMEGHKMPPKRAAEEQEGGPGQ